MFAAIVFPMLAARRMQWLADQKMIVFAQERGQRGERRPRRPCRDHPFPRALGLEGVRRLSVVIPLDWT